MTLTGFPFHIPGATVRLDGTYGLESEQLNFHGTVTTEVQLSQMTTGAKSKLLKRIFIRSRRTSRCPQ